MSHDSIVNKRQYSDKKKTLYMARTIHVFSSLGKEPRKTALMVRNIISFLAMLSKSNKIKNKINCHLRSHGQSI